MKIQCASTTYGNMQSSCIKSKNKVKPSAYILAPICICIFKVNKYLFPRYVLTYVFILRLLLSRQNCLSNTVQGV
jgi:hypothetical protein